MRRREEIESRIDDEVEAMARLLDNSGQATAAAIIRRRTQVPATASAGEGTGLAEAAG